MGVNLGASLSPLICGYIGETYGWHYGFGLATIGMMVGLAIFVMPTLVTQLLIGMRASAPQVRYSTLFPDNSTAIAVNAFVALSLVIAGAISIRALALGGVPDDVGRPPGAVQASGYNPPGHRSLRTLVLPVRLGFFDHPRWRTAATDLR